MLTLLAILGCVPSAQPVPDADHDGFSADVDCDDSEADAFPGAVEFCDGIDNNCNGLVDDEAIDATPWYRDEDADRFGAEAVLACEAPEGFVEVGGDCDDTRPDVRPLRTEVCDGIDNNCDGSVDINPDIPFFPDADGDGWGDSASPQRTCTPDPDWVADGSDCDDSDPDISPQGIELCDGVDNNCDGLVDDDDPAVQQRPTWFPDADGDGFGTPDFSVLACLPPAGSWSLDDQDCDDFFAEIAPGAPESCNLIDDDCDGIIDLPDAPLSLGPRASVSLQAVDALTDPVFLSTVDLQALYAASGGVGDVDPGALRVAIGSCGGGLSELPVRFLDDLDDLDTPGIDGDSQGALVISYDPDLDPTTPDSLAPGQVESGWLYFSPSAGVGSAGASSSSLHSGVTTATFDDGLLLTDLGPAGNLSQLGFRPRIDTPAGALAWTSATTIEVDDHPALSRVRASGVQSNGAGSIAWEADWLLISGRPELHGLVRIDTADDTTLQQPGDWRTAVVGFSAQVDGTPTQVGTDWLYQSVDNSALFRVVDSGGGVATAAQGWFEVRGTDLPGGAGDSQVIPDGSTLANTAIVLLSHQGSGAVETLAQLDANAVLIVEPSAP